jgi:hypothetical protein
MGVGVLLRVIPFYSVIIPFIILGYLLYMSPDGEKENIDYWDKHAQELKEAYSAKFGGENTGFNDEVDKHILIMKKLGNSFTRTLAWEWLKRMDKFTDKK